MDNDNTSDDTNIIGDVCYMIDEQNGLDITVMGGYPNENMTFTLTFYLDDFNTILTHSNEYRYNQLIKNPNYTEDKHEFLIDFLKNKCQCQYIFRFDEEDDSITYFIGLTISLKIANRFMELWNETFRRHTLTATITMDELLELNYNWWTTPKSTYNEHCLYYHLSYYNRDDIIEENNYSDNIIQLNKHIVTIDSQENVFRENINEYFHPKFVESVSERDSIDYNELINTPYICEYQRAYLEIITTTNKGNKIWNILRKNKNIAIFFCDINGSKMNNTMKQISKNNRVQLTYYVLKKALQKCCDLYEDRVNIIEPTNFFLNTHDIILEISNITDKFNCITKDDICKLVLIAKCPSYNVNNMFEQLLQCFE